MSHFKFKEKHLWQHKTDGLIVWSIGKHFGKYFTAEVVSANSKFKHGTIKTDWLKDEFKCLAK